MAVNPQIVFRGVARSAGLESLIRAKVGLLERLCDQIISCRVTIEDPHRRHRHENRFNVQVYLVVPGDEIVVTHEPGGSGREEDAYAAVHATFDAARRQLEDYSHLQRRLTKNHDHLWSVGHVTDLFRGAGFGFITCPDERRVYFHCNSVERNRFSHLIPGTPVMFIEETGEDGPQAAAVRLLEHESQRVKLPVFPRWRYEAPW